ncbi:hypothetical protein EV175_007578, partial [Coemansia sp. RSA 1933]
MKLFSTTLASFALAMVTVAVPIGKYGGGYEASYDGLDSARDEASDGYENHSGIDFSFDHSEHTGGDYSVDHSFASMDHSHREDHYSDASDDDEWGCDDESDYEGESYDHESDHYSG